VRAVQQHFIEHPPRPGDELPEATLRRAVAEPDDEVVVDPPGDAR
jgi:hypothetical protein